MTLYSSPPDLVNVDPRAAISAFAVAEQVGDLHADHYVRAAQPDDEMGLAFLQVVNLLATPATLLTPVPWRE